MKLNNSHRDAFIRAVIDDVPQIDYDDICRKKCVEWGIGLLPVEVRAVYDKYPNYIHTFWFGTPGCLNSVYVPGVSPNEQAQAAIKSELQDLANAKSAQSRKLRELEQQLKAAIYSVTTLKRAKEILPEFEKYLPNEISGAVDRSMPTISNLVSSLVEAGWPKNQGTQA